MAGRFLIAAAAGAARNANLGFFGRGPVILVTKLFALGRADEDDEDG